MKKENSQSECCLEMTKCKPHHGYNHGGSGAIYGLGIIGALFYFLQGATTFTAIMTGIGKAIFWPAIILFELLTYLQI